MLLSYNAVNRLIYLINELNFIEMIALFVRDEILVKMIELEIIAVIVVVKAKVVEILILDILSFNSVLKD